MRKLIILLLPFIGYSTTLHVDALLTQQKLATVITDANKPVYICSEPSGSTCPTTYNIPGQAGGNKMVFAMSYTTITNVNLRNSSPTTCNNPCILLYFAGHGKPTGIAEEVTSGGANLNPRNVFYINIEDIRPTPVVAASVVFPREVIGQDGYTDLFQLAIPGGFPTTGCSIYDRVNSTGYINPVPEGYDSKFKQRIWYAKTGTVANDPIGPGGTGTASYSPLDNSHITQIDEFGKRGAIDGAHGIGGAVQTIEFLTPIPDNSFTANSTIVVDTQFTKTDGVTSGGRFLYIGITCGAASTITSLDVNSNVATAHVSGIPFGGGQTVLISGAPGWRGRFNGARIIGSVASGTFTFPTCGSGAGFYMINCTTPNATGYAPPVVNANSGTLSAYPVATVQPTMSARLMIPNPTIVSYDDPTTYTAPVGGNATRGKTLFTTRGSLLNSNNPDLNYTLLVACSDCHVGNPNITNGWNLPGSDLAALGYSNKAIEERTLFHASAVTAVSAGWQAALDMAAYIRSIPSTSGSNVNVYSNCRPFNPIFQPGPGLDSNPVDQWWCGIGVDGVQVYDCDTKEDLTGTVGCANSATSLITNAQYGQVVNFRQISSIFQLEDWNHWLPAIHPADAFPTVNFLTDNGDHCNNSSPPFVGLLEPNSCYIFLTNQLAANNGAAFQSNTFNLEQFRPIGMLSIYNNFNGGSSPQDCNQNLNGNTIVQGSCPPPGLGYVKRGALTDWGQVKKLELFMPNGVGFCSQIYTGVFGARPTGSYQARCFPALSRGQFDHGDHIINGIIAGANNHHSTNAKYFPYPNFAAGFAQANNASYPFYYHTNDWYQPYFDWGNFHQITDWIVDSGYYPGFLNTESQISPCYWNCLIEPTIFNFQGSADLNPAVIDPSLGVQWYAFVDGAGNSVGYTGLSLSAAYTSDADKKLALDFIITNLTSLGNAYSYAQWASVTAGCNFVECNPGMGANPPANFDPANCLLFGNPAASNIINTCFQGLLDLGNFYGVNSTHLSSFATWLNGLSYGINGASPQWDFNWNLHSNGKAFPSKLGGVPVIFNDYSDYIWTNVTTLGAGIASTPSSGNISVTLSSCAVVANGTTFQVDSEEFIAVSGFGGAGSCTGTATRATFQTSAASHSNGANVNN